jgi:FKBP-type peptidyl-prolyl cis-trans isomerase SlyD
VAGLESELRGRRAGDELTVTVAPEDAYGARDPTAVQRVPIKHLVRPGKLAVGKVVAVNTSVGPRRATVLKVGRFNVDVDLNHPLAGKTLIFDVKVLDVREATSEEIAHGHAHGPGGAHA